MLVRFDEDGQEQEMVVPSNWVKGNILFYPNSIKTKFLFKTRAAPGPNWKSYSVTKVVVTGDKETCDNYEFATSCDESLLSVKSAKKYEYNEKASTSKTDSNNVVTMFSC